MTNLHIKMDDPLTLCMQLLRLAQLTTPNLGLVSVQSILVDLFGDRLDSAQLNRLIEAFRLVGDERANADALLEVIDTALASLVVDSDDLCVRMGRFSYGIDMAIMLKWASEYESESHIVFNLLDLALFYVIQRLAISAVNNQPPTTIVGLSTPSSQVMETVISPGDSRIERNIEISYNSREACPQLHVKLPCRRLVSESLKSRRDYRQKPSPSYDLDIYSYNEHKMGRIKTRPLQLPHKVVGQGFTIVFDEEMGITPLVTSIEDQDENEVFRSIRLVIAGSQQPV